MLEHGNKNQIKDKEKNIPLINLKMTINITNDLKRQFVDFLKKYPCITYVTNYLAFKLQKFTLK